MEHTLRNWYSTYNTYSAGYRYTKSYTWYVVYQEYGGIIYRGGGGGRRDDSGEEEDSTQSRGGLGGA